MLQTQFFNVCVTVFGTSIDIVKRDGQTGTVVCVLRWKQTLWCFLSFTIVWFVPVVCVVPIQLEQFEMIHALNTRLVAYGNLMGERQTEKQRNLVCCLTRQVRK